MSVRLFLVVRASGDARVTRRRPSLRYDEVAFPITVEFPQGWARVYDELAMTLTVPAPSVEPPRVEEPLTRTLRSGGRHL